MSPPFVGNRVFFFVGMVMREAEGGRALETICRMLGDDLRLLEADTGIECHTLPRRSKSFHIFASLRHP